MSIQERDKEIFEVIVNAYIFEWEHKERLDNKLNNFIAIAATIATLYVGIGFFSLEKISIGNPYYLAIVSVFLLGVVFFVSAIIMSLYGYKPVQYYVTPADPKRLIEKYKALTKTHVVREVAATTTEALLLNREINIRKADLLQRVFWVLSLGILMILIFAVLLVLALVVV